MIVSHKFNLVFIHIPKTGGSFIHHIIKKLDPSAIEIENFKGQVRSGHLMFHEIEQLDIYENIKLYSFFTAIRNPIGRYVSDYNFILGLEDAHYLFPQTKNKSFYEFTNTPYVYLGKMVDYIKNKNGKINKNIKLLQFNNLSFDLFNFLSSINLPKDDLEKIKPFIKEKINVSKKFFKEDIDISKLNLNDFHLEDLLFYLSIDNMISDLDP